MAEHTAPPIVLHCERERCEYVVYGDSDNPEHNRQAQDFYADHLRQHDDPEGWKAEHGPEAVAAREDES